MPLFDEHNNEDIEFFAYPFHFSEDEDFYEEEFSDYYDEYEGEECEFEDEYDMEMEDEMDMEEEKVCKLLQNNNVKNMSKMKLDLFR